MQHYYSEIIASANPPTRHGKRACMVEFIGRDGWEVWCFYEQGGAFGYVDHLTSPWGDKIEPWRVADTDPLVDLRRWKPAAPTTH
ncbi:hypothetical protein [Bosea sp. BK604]|uniref:hypothetical protein n=1 Tax=Bosea sp. BK604 TaxID=2512180 RepID=UPI00105328C0|nr:hypothetical protein [Bosea sp. BK604]TCR68187.1 hypothetical protein EV560_10213 [Bosea sp. BK604]